MKGRNEGGGGELKRRTGMRSKNTEKTLVWSLTIGSKRVTWYGSNLVSQTLQGRQIYVILSHFPSAPHKPRKMGAIQ